MKNKLLLTTAIAGLMAVGGVAQAETKVSGNLEQTFRAISDDASNGAASQSGLGAEYNIGLSSSAELDNGLTAKFGFNLEANAAAYDSGDAGPDVHFLTIGNDTMSVSVARDNGNNLSASGIPHISDTASTVVGGGYNNLGVGGSDGHNDDHIRADINAAGGTFTLRYVPTDGGTNGSSKIPAENENSAYDVIYRGSLGVEGLSVVAGMHKVDGTGSAVDTKLNKYSVAYNFGQFAAGVEIQKSEDADATTATQKNEKDSQVASVTFAVNDKLSLGLARYETEYTANGTKDPQEEKINMIGVGYSLGGVAIDINYAMTENYNFGTTDRDVLQIRTIQKF